MKDVLLLGASGSIGQQTIDILLTNPSDFNLVGFSVGHRDEFVPLIIHQFPNVKMIYLIDEEKRNNFSKIYPSIVFFSGDKGLLKLVRSISCDIVVNALVGFVGLRPSLIALERNKILCLANKEALVTGGHLINNLLNKGKGKLYPIDSEHVALAKCLNKVEYKDVDKLLITASGGALRDIALDKLAYVSKEDALKHPNWKMGDKITIDCATMINKGFELIEAYYLFHYELKDMEVLMHKESLIHSGLKLKDGTYLFDYGKPDMHTCIEFALFEGKIEYQLKHVSNLEELDDCHFSSYDKKRYPLLEIAKNILEEKDVNKMVALNAINEIAVHKFLNNKISFLDIVALVEKVVKNTKCNYNPSLRKIIYLDKQIREENE